MNEGISKHNHPFYLANVLAIAKADGHVQLRESEVVRAIVRRIGATDEDLTQAAGLLASGTYRIRMPDLPAERMANIQDMILVALAHGDVAPGEAAPIEQAAKQLGYVQTDINLAVRRAEQELRKIEADKGRSAPPPASPTPLNRAATPMRPPPVAPPARMASPKPLPPPKPVPPPNPTPKRMSAPVPTPARKEPPAALPSEPQPGTPPNPATIEPPPADGNSDLSRRVTACIACRTASDEPVPYCFGLPDGSLNVWGCRLAGMDWTPGATWFSLGAFLDDETFILDKQAIADRLSTNLSDVLGCPHLQTVYTEKAFDTLRARVSVRGHWHYREADAGDPDNATVHVTRYIHGCPITTQEEVSGIDPIGTREAEKLLRRAMKASGRHDLDPRRVARIGVTAT